MSFTVLLASSPRTNSNSLTFQRYSSSLLFILDIKISLGINRTTRPALNKVVKTSSYYISNFFIFCNSLLKKISTGLLHTLKSYGQILCLLTYTTLSLERPTILGFVFCFIVFCGSIFPDMVFERGTPGVLIYTMGYSMVRDENMRDSFISTILF